MDGTVSVLVRVVKFFGENWRQEAFVGNLRRHEIDDTVPSCNGSIT